MSNTPEQPTCGKGLAANSVLPRKLGELVAAMGQVLEVHMKALDLEDVHSKQEFEAYKDLARVHRHIAASLAATAQEMSGYRHLPMGRHDEKAMADPRGLEVFENFVRHKQELLTLLQEMIVQDQSMLDKWA
ncbi:MAG TPA: hypothetical protein VFZ76_18470 [Anaerolineales bacterium]